jgi:hypothetical protein
MLTCSLTNRGYTVGTNEETKDQNNTSATITTCDALLVVLTDNTFSNDVSTAIRAALNSDTPVVCVVHANDKTKIGDFLRSAPDDLKTLGAHSIFHIETNDPDYLQCGVTKILRASGHVTAPAIDPTSIIVRDNALTSDVNRHYVMSVLKNGKVPPLPAGCTHHFFISKDEKYKDKSILIATWLTEMGFSVWESQLEKEHRRGVAPDDM